MMLDPESREQAWKAIEGDTLDAIKSYRPSVFGGLALFFAVSAVMAAITKK